MTALDEGVLSYLEFRARPEGFGAPHIGPVFGYVLEGEYEHAIDNEPIETFKAGDTFYEPTGSVHRVAPVPARSSRLYWNEA